ncbi:MAG: hypothetical protein FWH46_02250 [Methanimicrococcus sp.]|nr:hypothetical protein [Methanimicrococcus sp.]
MSIESDSEFFEIGEFSDKYKNFFGERVPSSVFDNDFDDDRAGDYQPYFYGSDLPEDDFDFEDKDENEDFAANPFKETSAVGILSYDYEMDTVDTLNLVDQINAYASDFWECIAVVGDSILFKKPKYV